MLIHKSITWLAGFLLFGYASLALPKDSVSGFNLDKQVPVISSVDQDGSLSQADCCSGEAGAPGFFQEPRPTIITATPQGDGAVYHTVGQGETLWSIAQAYGITTDRLMLLNGFTEETETIYTGQRLLVQFPPLAVTVTMPAPATATPEPETTLDPPLAIPTLRQSTSTPQPYLTPTMTQEEQESIIRKERLTRSLLLAGGILVGFLVLFALIFRSPRQY